MIFWIVTGLIVIGYIWFVIWMTIEDGWVSGIISMFLGALVFGLAWNLVAVRLVTVGLTHLAGANKVETTVSELRALGSDSSTEGRFYFLGGGYVDGKRVLSYVTKNDDGSFTPGQVDANASKVWETDTETPKMVTHEHIADHGWIVPGEYTLTNSYEFTVPEGSVSDEYEVRP